MMSVLDRFRGPIGLLGALVILCGYLAWTFARAESMAAEVDGQRRHLLQQRVALADSLAQARAREDRDRIRRIRLQIRSGVRWTADHLAREGVLWVDPDASSSAIETDARRLHGLLRSALDDWEGALAIELLVAGDQGIWTHRVEPRPPADLSPPSPPRTPQTLWYAPSVQRALAAAGRRTHAGKIRWEEQGGEGPDTVRTPVARLVIALHEPGEVMQGALLVSLDAAALADELAAISSDRGGHEVELALWTLAGRSLRPNEMSPGFAGFEPAELVSSLLESESEASDELLQMEDSYLAGTILAHEPEDPASVLLVGKVAVPDREWVAWWHSGYAGGLVALILMGFIQWYTRGVRLDPAVVRYEVLTESPPADSTAAKVGPLPVPEADAEPAPLLGWLGDIRSCLERDAATHGRNFSLLCERGISPEMVPDATRVGGLLVAMGREALRRTQEESVTLEVRENSPDHLRFEIDAGQTPLAPLPGMLSAAAALGARFDECPAGRMAILLAVPDPLQQAGVSQDAADTGSAAAA